MTYEKILVPLDGSSLAEAALPHAKAVAQKFGAELVLLQVVPTFTELFREVAPVGGASGSPELSIDVAKQRHSAERASAEAYLERVKQSLNDEGLKARTVVEEGSPSPTILKAAKETGTNLIAMSTHGRTGLGRALMGSVSDEVLRTSGLPVLIVRPERPHEARPT